MKRPKKRLRKKYSRKLIDDICLYVSQSNALRERFFEAKEGEEFDLSNSDLASVPLLCAVDKAMIRKYRLRFTVAVHSKFSDSYKDDKYDCIVLWFWAKEFPEVFAESTNSKWLQ